MVLLAYVLFQGELSVERIQQLVDKKDVAALTAGTTIRPGELNPFNVLKTGGAYGVGRFGWKALPLKSPDGQRYVVLSTPLTSEDIGEIVLKRVGKELRFVPEQDALGVKVHRHSFDLRFIPQQKKAALVDQMTVTSSSGTGSFLFRMSPANKVGSIASDGRPVPFSQAGGVVLLPRKKGKSTYTIKYSALVDLPDYAGSVSEREATLTNDYWYPMIARQPAPYDIAITAPKDWTAVGQGAFISSDLSGDQRVTRYRMDLPCVYYSVSAAPYKTVEGEARGRKVWTRSIRMNPERMALQPELYAPILNFYSDSFGAFPFSSYGALDSEVYGGGALEAYSFATYGGGLPTEDAHEPSHTWWGGILNNTYLQSFWNESFAVYSDGLYHRSAPVGNQEARSLAFISVAQGQGGFERFPIQGSGAFVGPDASSLGYGKGALVLQMLEQIIGTDGMKKAMSEWIRADHGKAVDWPDFERIVMRLFPDQELKPFFDDWLRTPGYARIALGDVELEGGRIFFELKFSGTQYHMPLEVMVEAQNGQRAFETIRVKGSGRYSVGAPNRWSILSIDPHLRALRRIADDEYAPEIQRHVFRYKRWTDPAHKDWLGGVGRTTLESLPSDLDGVFVVGHPDTTPRLRQLCAAAGFKVDGQKLTYKGTTIDLDHGAAMALLNVPGGQCVIGLGKTLLAPNAGRAKIAILDEYGRFLDGETLPKRSGTLTAASHQEN
jgi:hypothetical protein